jgi:hypothetical protein
MNPKIQVGGNKLLLATRSDRINSAWEKAKRSNEVAIESEIGEC